MAHRSPDIADPYGNHSPDHDYRDSLWETQFLGILACSFLVKMRLLFMVGESKGGWP